MLSYIERSEGWSFAKLNVHDEPVAYSVFVAPAAGHLLPRWPPELRARRADHSCKERMAGSILSRAGAGPGLVPLTWPTY